MESTTTVKIGGRGAVLRQATGARNPASVAVQKSASMMPRARYADI